MPVLPYYTLKTLSSLPTATRDHLNRLYRLYVAGSNDVFYVCRQTAAASYEWIEWGNDTAGFDEAAQDAVGGILTDSSSIDFTYTDGGPTITAAIIDEYVQDVVGAMATDGTGINFTYNDGANTITAEPIFAGTGSAGTVARSDHDHAVTRFFPWIAGRYYHTASYLARSGTSFTLAQDVLRAVPLYVPATETVDRISIEVTVAAAAGKVARLGIYDAGADGLPDALVLDAGTVATDGTGTKEITISQSLTGESWYWLTLVSDGGGTLWGFSSSTGVSPLGNTTVGGGYVHAVERAFTYAALPDPWGTPGFTTGNTPLIAVRST